MKVELIIKSFFDVRHQEKFRAYLKVRKGWRTRKYNLSLDICTKTYHFDCSTSLYSTCHEFSSEERAKRAAMETIPIFLESLEKKGKKVVYDIIERS